MTDPSRFVALSPCALADVLAARDRVMDAGIRPLFAPMPRVAGPAFPVQCAHGDNLMLHAAIYRAPPGSIVVVQSADSDFAVCGGNVCAIAQRRGIAAFVIDGVVRDLAETRERGFPVFARGVIPIPGGKDNIGVLNGPVRCGGVEVAPGDIVVADEEGIVVVPAAREEAIFVAAQRRVAKEEAESLDVWEAAHHARVEAVLREKGFVG